MKFKVLGRLEISRDDGMRVEIRQPQQRHLMTTLLLNANRPVSAGQLSEALWNEPFDKPRAGALRTHIWALRRLLTPDQRLTKEIAGYSIRIYPGELDLDAFRQLASTGRRALAEGDFCLAEASFSQADALWSEPPLADLPLTLAGSLSSLKLTGERDAISDLLIDVRMRLGKHRDLLPELQAQVTAQPENEHRWAQLLLALYRSDQQIRALQAYNKVRDILVGEYGVDPGPKLRRLHDQILRSDPELDLPLTACR